MLTQNTVFILGAGANVPYGFSTGGGLIDKLRGVDPQARMGNAGQQITRQESEAFRLAMLDNLLPSIDAMLEHRADLVKVGVTFNYDRYLEHRFIRGLVARYNVNPRQAWEAVKMMFIHLYGSLGELTEQGTVAPNAMMVPLGAPETNDTYNLGLALQAAEQMITIVHDAAQPPESFAEALRRFQTSERCVFLGFGFGRKNVERLQTFMISADVLPKAAAAFLHCRP